MTDNLNLPRWSLASFITPGVIFPYSSEDHVYPLEMIPITYGIKSSVEDGNVKATSSEANIATLLGNTL
jgi:hypothetical protein